MNRIRELIDEEIPYWPRHNEGIFEWDIFDVERFVSIIAERVVKDCISLCDEVDRINQHYIKTEHIDPELGPADCITVIKARFGVRDE